MDSNVENDARAGTLGDYFNQNEGCSGTFFDQLLTNSGESAMMSSVVASPSTQKLFDGLETAIPAEATNEPAICRIFAGDKAGGNSFFDVISGDKTCENDWTCTGNLDDGYPSALEGFDDLGGIAQGTDVDRTKEAWIPSDATRRVLIMAATKASGSYTPESELLTHPGLVLEEDLVDNVTQLVKHHLGEAEAAKRKVLTLADVPNDEKGLKQLMEAECYRAAINLTGRLLTVYGQGANRQGRPSKHTVHSIQLWFTRLSLLVKIGCYQIADAESSVWWNLDRPDLYYQFYPELYGGKPGTMVPFQMRLLIATLPAYVKKFPIAIERLYSLVAVIRNMLKNLDDGKSEDGSLLELTVKCRDIAKRVWKSREARLLHSIANVAIMAKEYALAVEVLQSLIERESNTNTQKRAIYSALGRVLLQVGNIRRAEQCFANAASLHSSGEPDMRQLVDSGLLAIANNSFHDAYKLFSTANELSPTDPAILNNMAVCLLYKGKLRAAVALLNQAIEVTPALALHEALVINLSTLYELDSSRSDANKKSLLTLVAKYRGDAFNVASLKLHK